MDGISKVIEVDELDLYFGQLPEEKFALDYYYGKYVNVAIIKNSIKK